MSVTLEELLEHVKIPPAKLNQQPSREHLVDIAKKMSNWESYASYLGLNHGEIDDLKEENKKSVVQGERALFMWQERLAFKATYRFLVEDVFLKGKNAAMAQFICELLK